MLVASIGGMKHLICLKIAQMGINFHNDHRDRKNRPLISDVVQKSFFFQFWKNKKNASQEKENTFKARNIAQLQNIDTCMLLWGFKMRSIVK